jgi:hypothetical protein
VTPTREAITLPLVFLTVVLAGSVRLGPPLQFSPPPLFALLLGLMLVGALAQSGALIPAALINPERSALENLNGFAVMLTLFAASAQAMAILLPTSGVPAVMMSVLLFALLAQALAINPPRAQLLRGLMVSVGVAFVLKFIVLDSLSAPATGGIARFVQFVFEGVTFGSVTQSPLPRASGYIAFATLILHLFGIILLPRRGEQIWVAGELIADRSSGSLQRP